MAKFLTELHIRPHPEHDKFWLLDEPLVYQSDLIDELITVPQSFCTDLASTNHIPFVTLIWGGCAHREAVVHDYLYALDAEPDVTRTTADEIFYEAMVVRGKPAWKRYPLYWGVVCGGWPFYRKTLVDKC